MFRSNTDDLLRPSLVQDHGIQAPYSQQTGFLVAFFGGPIAALMMGAVNAERLRRLPRDAVWLGLALAAYIGLMYWLGTPPGHQLMASLAPWIGSEPSGTLASALGLLGFGLNSLLHGTAQRTASLMGVARPKGTWVGVGLIVVGGALARLVQAALS